MLDNINIGDVSSTALERNENRKDSLRMRFFLQETWCVLTDYFLLRFSIGPPRLEEIFIGI